MMRDLIRPGGTARDLDAAGRVVLGDLLARIGATFPALMALYDRTASLQDRTVATGILRPDLARSFGAGGFVGRASGRDFDTRRDLAHAPYDRLSFSVPGREDGDVNARLMIRAGEVDQSLSLIRQILDGLPDGPHFAQPAPTGPAEALGLVEGFRGDVLVWLRAGRRRPHRPLPSARSVLVPVAAPGSGDRGQHHRRLPALQQILQLLLFGARPVKAPPCASS